MSYRELRKFAEIMRTAGYPRRVSVEDFRLPNFELVADVLLWMLRLLDPGAAIYEDISTESDRIEFLKAAGHVALRRARLRLNLKKLYGADALAVRELLKIAGLLEKACTLALKGKHGGDEVAAQGLERTAATANSIPKGLDVRLARQLASEATQVGASLYVHLSKEADLGGQRAAAVSRTLELDAVERAVQEAIAVVQETSRSVEKTLGALEKDKKSLESKVEKRKLELERGEKRLASLQSVRPAYMDEYEVLQSNLQNLFKEYSEKFRNLQYLEGRLEEERSKEQERVQLAEKKLRKIQRKLKDEELRILRGDQGVEDRSVESSGSNLSDEEEDDKSAKESSQVEKGKMAKLIGDGISKVRGNIVGNIDESSEDSTNSSNLTDESSQDVSIRGSATSDDLLDDDIESDDESYESGSRDMSDNDF